MAATLDEQARDAIRLVEADPAQSAALARAVADQARRGREFAPLCIAERALGLAALHLEDPDSALRHLRGAVRLGRRAGSAQLAAEAQMSLAYALIVRGRGQQALLEIEAALRCLSGSLWRARAQAQRGAILHQVGRLDEAFRDYQAALPPLRRGEDYVWVQRVLYNRAVLYGHRQEFAAAEADLHEAAGLCTQLGLELSLGFVHQNLGWLNALRGEVPAALRYLDLAEQCLRAHSMPVDELLTDRCLLLLSVRLLGEALQTAQEAVQEFERLGRRIGLPEARLMLAQAAILQGQARHGLDQARMAAREFSRQGRVRWAVLARFTVLRARLAVRDQHGDRPRVGPGQLERVAGDLAAAGWPGSALDARLLAGQAALQQGQPGRARAQLQLAAGQRGRGPAMQRAQAWHAEALLREAEGNGRGAAAAARAALRILDEHRAGLGATDLRAHAAGHRVDVATLGLRLALDSGSPARVLAWAEHGRASHLMLRPARAPSDPGLAAALSELRVAAGKIPDIRGSGGSAYTLERRQVSLERQIRDHYRRLPGERVSPDAGPVPARALAGSLGDSALVEFIQHRGALHAITVTSRRIQLHQLGPAEQAGDLVGRVRFALHRLARPHASEASTAAAIQLLTHAAGRLEELLLRPVARETGGRPLVVVPTGALQSLPWAVLPSCAGQPVTVTPSAALWHRARSGPSPAAQPVVAAGPGLRWAETEAATVAALYGSQALTGAAATVEAVIAQLDGARLAHLAAHGRIHPDNPLFSSLEFADGPLTVYDLEQLSAPPQLVVLAACDVGRSTVRPGDELMGLSATFLALGTRHVVASVVPIPDAETAPLMIAFHRLLAAGAPAPAALAQAQAGLGHSGSGDPAAMAASAGFVSIGTRGQ